MLFMPEKIHTGVINVVSNINKIEILALWYQKNTKEKWKGKNLLMM